MAITTYSELKTAVARWTAGSDSATAASMGLTDSIDDLVTIAESRIFRETRTADTEASMSTSIGSGVVALPTNFISIKFLYINSSPTQILEPKPAEWIYQNYPQRSSDGRPKVVGRDGSNLIFGPYPDSNYSIGGVYYKRLGALSSGVHALFTNNPDLYLFGCLAESAILIGQDSRIALWEQKYQKILNDVNNASRNSEYGGGNLRMRLG
jgi:hypothetical protein